MRLLCELNPAVGRKTQTDVRNEAGLRQLRVMSVPPAAEVTVGFQHS